MLKVDDDNLGFLRMMFLTNNDFFKYGNIGDH